MMKTMHSYSRLRLLRYCSLFVVSLVLFVNSVVNVSARDSDDLPVLSYVENQEIYIGDLEYLDTPRFNETYILESGFGLLASRSEYLNATSMNYYAHNHTYGVGYPDQLTGAYAIGNVITVSRCRAYIDLLNNSGLFTESGTLTLRLYSQCSNYNQSGLDSPWSQINVFRTSKSAPDILYYDRNCTTEVEIDNSSNDVYRIQVFLYHGCNNTQMSLGIVSYDYVPLSGGTDEELVDTSKNIFELLKDFIGGFWSNIQNRFTTALSSVTNAVSGLANNFNNFVTNFVSNIQNAIIGLFVPSDDVLTNYIIDMRDTLQENLGFVWTLIEWVSEFLNDLKNAIVGDAIITFPEVKWEQYVIIPKTDVNLQSIVDKFPLLQSTCRIATSFVCAWCVVILCQNKLKEWLA